MDSLEKLDGLWSCYVCFVNFSVGMFCFGIQNSYGIIHIAVIQQFEAKNVESAWLGSLAFGATFLFSPFSNVLCDVVPPSQVSITGLLLCTLGLLLSSFATSIPVLFITYGVCFGIGASFTYFPTVLALKIYFKRYLSLANGISASGSGLGTLLFGPLIEYSVGKFGLRWMFRFCAAIAAVLIVMHIIFIYIDKKFQSTMGALEKQPFLKHLQSALCREKICFDQHYQIMVASMAIFVFGYFVPYVHLTFMATKKGITTAKAAFLISYLSISSVVGKIFFGLLFHFCQIQVHRATAFSMLCIGISNCLVPFGDGYIVMCFYAVSCGIFEGCISGQIVMIVLGTVGSTKMAQGLANLFTINAVFMMTGPAVTGFVFDQTNSYEAAFILSGCLNFVGALLMVFLSIIISRREPRILGQNSDELEVKEEKHLVNYMLNAQDDYLNISNLEYKLDLLLISKETSL